MKLLIIEDDDNKREHIIRFLQLAYPRAALDEARSYRSGMDKIRSDPPDLLILDMTLPNFDVGPDEPGGQTRFFGGRDILRRLERLRLSIPVLVITQFEQFGPPHELMQLEHLDRQLSDAHSPSYLGAIYYHPSATDWQLRLSAAVDALIASLEGHT